MDTFNLSADYKPSGDQPQAISKLCSSLREGNKYQTLLGVTGSGKTFTMANVIKELQRPALILSHNKTLAAQLYSEFKEFFPENAVEYFVSYYDYYQPEAYIPQTDTFIEKDSSINDEIERHRISASSSLISRRDVIVVASVSCIYGLGSPEDFKAMMISIETGQEIGRDWLLNRMVENLYERNDVQLSRGNFRVRGETVDIFPAYMESAIRVEFWGDEVDSIRELDPLTGSAGNELKYFHLYPANQYITPKDKLDIAIQSIRKELESQVALFESENRLIEAQRVKMRTEYDLELLQEMGFCNGIENYSRHLSQRKAGERPWCLLDFFPDDFLIFIDESHVSMPQISGMYHGDRSRKSRLVDYGFRLPSALDNRPLQPDEFKEVTGQTIFVTATPAKFEMEVSGVVAEQLIRPTGLLDPVMEVRPIKGQVEDLINECSLAVDAKERVLVTTLTKRMTEEITDFLRDREFKVEYLHSDIDALERVEILRRLRAGDFDILVGVNLLREGLDLPEVGLVGILDADKEGFLRSETSIVQTAGRAARHEKGRVILYADVMTKSLVKAIETCEYRRRIQMEFNEKHGITPKSVVRPVQASLHQYKQGDSAPALLAAESNQDVQSVIKELQEEMLLASKNLQFEKAAILRDQIDALQSQKTQGAESVKPTKKKKRYVQKKGRP